MKIGGQFSFWIHLIYGCWFGLIGTVLAISVFNTIKRGAAHPYEFFLHLGIFFCLISFVFGLCIIALISIVFLLSEAQQEDTTIRLEPGIVFLITQAGKELKVSTSQLKFKKIGCGFLAFWRRRALFLLPYRILSAQDIEHIEGLLWPRGRQGM